MNQHQELALLELLNRIAEALERLEKKVPALPKPEPSEKPVYLDEVVRPPRFK